MSDAQNLFSRAECHARLLEAAAALLEADGVGIDPEQGHVKHLRRMAGTIRAQAALGRVAQRYATDRYLPEPAEAASLAAVVPHEPRHWH